MVSLDAGLKSLAAAAALAFGLLVLLGGGGAGRRASRWLALFLFLIAGNQAAEAARAIVTDPALQHTLRRLAAVFASLDPVALYCFASLHPDRNALDRPLPAALVLATGGVLALYGGWALGTPRTLSAESYDAARSIYTALVYTVVLAWALDGVLREPASPTWMALLAASSVAALQPWMAAVSASFLAWHLTDPTPIPAYVWGLVPLTVVLLLVAGLLAWLLARARRHPSFPQVSRTLPLALGLGGAWVLLVGANDLALHLALLRQESPVWETIHRVLRATVSMRWLVFGFLMSIALLRHNMLGMSLAARRRAARVLVGGAFLAAAAALLLVVRSATGDQGALRPAEAVLLLLVALTSQWARSLVDRVAASAYGVPREGDSAAAMETYRAALAQAAEEGRSPHGDPRLARLREELGLDARVAAVVERGVLAEGERLRAGRVLAGRYRLAALLGRGALGKVFRARDELLGRDVVVKEVAHGPDDATPLEEARLAGSLRHPNVVTLHDAIPGEETSFLVFELVEGGSLADRLASEGRPPPREALRLLDGLLAGLEAVHARGILHRDVKPANVLLDLDGTPKLADFGIARLRETRTLGEGRLVGTPAYLAPERRRGEPAGYASDVYAVGLLAREVLGPDAPPAALRVVERALEEDPARRWPDAGAMRRALAEALNA